MLVVSDSLNCIQPYPNFNPNPDFNPNQVLAGRIEQLGASHPSTLTLALALTLTLTLTPTLTPTPILTLHGP